MNPDCLDHWGCHNKTPWAGQLRNNRSLFLTVKAEIRVPMRSGEGPIPDHELGVLVWWKALRVAGRFCEAVIHS